MIEYKKRREYKYTLYLDYSYPTGIGLEKNFSGTFLSMDLEGNLSIKKGYSWDGPSGPTFDTKDFMRGSLVHDALYQLMRNGVIPRSETNRKKSDQIMKEICISAGMPRLFAHIAYWAVQTFGKYTAQSDLKIAP